MVQKVMSGNKAVVKVDGVVVGLFDSCQYGANLGTEAIHTLGRDSAAEIAITSYEAVQVSCSGFRIVGQGVHLLPKAPKLQDLIAFVRVQIEVKDRETGDNIAIIENCVPQSWGESQQAKGTTRFNIVYIGTVLSDEAGAQTEGADATDLP